MSNHVTVWTGYHPIGGEMFVELWVNGQPVERVMAVDTVDYRTKRMADTSERTAFHKTIIHDLRKPEYAGAR